MDVNKLHQLSSELLKCNEDAYQHFHHARETNTPGDFFSQVKPFADQVKQLCDEWEPTAVEWVLRNKPKNVYPMQIRNTAENMQMVSVRAFFPETSLKKFNSHIQSIDFVLRRLLEELDIALKVKDAK